MANYFLDRERLISYLTQQKITEGDKQASENALKEKYGINIENFESIVGDFIPLCEFVELDTSRMQVGFSIPVLKADKEYRIWVAHKNIVKGDKNESN